MGLGEKKYPFLRRGGRWVSSWSITHDGADFDLIESERSNFIFLLHARGLWAARALPNDPCYMERNLKNVRYWISIVFPSPFAFKTSLQMLCVGQDTFLLNTHPIFPIADSGWRRRLLWIQMELCENLAFSGPEKSYREIAAAVPSALAEPARGRMSMVFPDYWETTLWESGVLNHFPFLNGNRKSTISGPTIKSYSKENWAQVARNLLLQLFQSISFNLYCLVIKMHPFFRRNWFTF